VSTIAASCWRIERCVNVRIHALGQHGWCDRHGEGSIRSILVGLRYQGLLDRKAVLADMRARSHDGEARQRLDRFIDKTYREPVAGRSGA